MAEQPEVGKRWPESALLLAGHGSSEYPEGGSPALDHANALRKRGLFADVRAGFLRQQPEVSAVLAELKQPRIYVVPLLVNKGYIAEVVLAERLSLSGPITRRNQAGIEQELCFCDPVGSHAKIPDVIGTKISDYCRLANLKPYNIEVLLVGHGTPRSPKSSERTREVAGMLEEKGFAKRVHALFLEEEPLVDNWKDLVRARNIMVVPFLIGNWYHGSEDLPLRFDADPQEGVHIYQDAMEGGLMIIDDDRTLYFSSPFGVEPEISNIVVDLVDKFDAAHEPKL